MTDREFGERRKAAALQGESADRELTCSNSILLVITCTIEEVQAMIEEEMKTTTHEIVMTNRNVMEVSGVISVESFDSEEFLLQTDYGYLGIRGQDLHIQNLDLEEGRVSIEGHILDISYLDIQTPRAEKAKGLLGRLFK
ncbi:sporulation protein YabP [Polycladospora coralii]